MGVKHGTGRWMLGGAGVVFGLAFGQVRASAVEDEIWEFLAMPATNYAPNFRFEDWRVDSRTNAARRAATAPSWFRISHVHMNHHAEHLDQDPNMGAPFIRFHHLLLGGLSAWRMERGLDRLNSYRPPGPIPLGHVQFNTEVARPAMATPTVDAKALGTEYRMPPEGTLPAYPSLNALGLSMNRSVHAQMHHGIGYLTFDDWGQGADIISTDKTTFDPLFWMLHGQIDDVAECWRSTQATDVVVAVDRSGSASGPTVGGVASTNRLAAMREGVQFFSHLLTSDRNHRLGVVSFAGAATTNLGLTLVGSAGFSNTLQSALASMTSSGPTALGAGVGAAVDLATAGTNASQVVLLLTDGAGNADPRWTPWNPGSPVDAGRYPQAPAHHDDRLIPVHSLAFGPGYLPESGNLPAASLARYGHHVATEAGAYGLKQRLVGQFAEMFDLGTVRTESLTLASGPPGTASGVFEVRSVSDVTLEFVLVWDQPVTARSVLMEVTTPSGALLNLAAAGVRSVAGPTWHIVQVNAAPNTTHDGVWKARAVRAANGAALNLTATVLSRGLGRVEPSPRRARWYTGDTLRPVFRVRDPYWSAEGYDSLEARVEVYRPAASAGTQVALAAPRSATSVSGDPVSARQATLEALVASNPGLFASGLVGTFALEDDGTGGDESGGDHVFEGALPGLATVEGDYHFRALFTFRKGGVAFTREASYGLRVDTRVTSETAVTAGTVVDVGEGRREVALRFRPRDTAGNAYGPGRAADLRLALTDGAEVMGTVSEPAWGEYEVKARFNGVVVPRVLVHQAGADPVVLGNPAPVGMVEGPTLTVLRPTNAIVRWRTTVASTGVVEFGEGGVFDRAQADPDLVRSHRLVVTNLRAGRTYQFRVRARASDGSEARSAAVPFGTPPNSVVRVELDRMGYNDPETNVITGRFVLYEPAAETVTVPVGTTQVFNLQNALTNATSTVTIPAGAVAVPFRIETGPVTNAVEVIVLPFYGDLSAHGMCQLLPPSFQVLSATNGTGPYRTNTVANINPYYRTIRDPVCSTASFLRVLSSEATELRILRIDDEELRVGY